MQSVLSVPFVISPVAEAAGDFAPSTDGAFLQSFAEALPDQAGIAEAETDLTGFGIVQVVAVPLALFPGGSSPLGDQALAAPTAAIRERAGAGSLVASELSAGPSPAPTDFALSGADAAGAGSGAWPLSAEPLAAMQTLGAPVASTSGLHTGVAEPLQAIATDPADLAKDTDARQGQGGAFEDASAVLQPLAGPSGEADATTDPRGFSARPDAVYASPVANAERGRAAPPTRANDGGLPVPPPAGMAGHGTSLPLPPDGFRPDAALSQRVERAIVEPRAVPTEAVPAAMQADLVRTPLPQGGSLAETSVEPLLVISTTASGGEGVATHFNPPRRAFAEDPWVSGPAWAATRGNAAAGPLGDPASLPGPAEGAEPERSPASRPTPSAGFWEQLLTGLSAGMPTNPVPADTGDHPVGEIDPDVRSEVEAATDAKAWVVTAPPAASERAATSLALIAKSLALQADAAADPEPDSDQVDPFAAGAAALPGLLAQGQGLPQSSPAGPIQLPVPQVAAQISSALTQSADGATELALSPEELGNVRLRLERDAKHPDRMVVHITFERPETLDLFRRHAGELAEALRDAGYAGADIGFGQEDGGAATPDRNQGAATPDYGSALIEAKTPEHLAPRLMAGASLDLRL